MAVIGYFIRKQPLRTIKNLSWGLGFQLGELFGKDKKGVALLKKWCQEVWTFRF